MLQEQEQGINVESSFLPAHGDSYFSQEQHLGSLEGHLVSIDMPYIFRSIIYITLSHIHVI